MKMRTFPAVVVLASALLVPFGCSDGGSGDPTTDPTDPTQNAQDFQIYLDNIKYTENGVIRLQVEGSSDYEYINIGTVTNGKGTLNFPQSPSNSYLVPLKDDVPSSISVSPKDVKIFDGEFYVISGNEAYRLGQTNNNGTEQIGYTYFSQAATIKGTAEECRNNTCVTYTYDVNATKGWNTLYIAITMTNNYSFTVSTDPSTVDLSKIKWIMEYEGSAEYYGGCDGSCSGNTDEPNTGYCVDHQYEECEFMQELHERGMTCSDWNGIPMDYCPYEGNGGSSTGDYCVDHQYEECALMEDILYYGITCSDWNGIPMDYCPDGYEL